MEEVSLNIISIEYSLNLPNFIYDDTVCELFTRDIKSHVPEVCLIYLKKILIFGTTKDCQKTCLHVHKFYPYLLVPLPEEIEEKKTKGFKSFLTLRIHFKICN
jgi:hypothetical protein